MATQPVFRRISLAGVPVFLSLGLNADPFPESRGLALTVCALCGLAVLLVTSRIPRAIFAAPKNLIAQLFSKPQGPEIMFTRSSAEFLDPEAQNA